MSLQNRYLPKFDFNEIHKITIPASATDVYNVIRYNKFSGSWITRTLMRLRGIRAHGKDQFDPLQMGFIPLGDVPSNEIVLGLVGQFWKPGGEIMKLSKEEFVVFERKDYLKATWNFEVTQVKESEVLLTTETRVYCLGAKSKNWFRVYWVLIKPFSGLIRRQMLRKIKEAAINNKTT